MSCEVAIELDAVWCPFAVGDLFVGNDGLGGRGNGIYHIDVVDH